MSSSTDALLKEKQSLNDQNTFYTHGSCMIKLSQQANCLGSSVKNEHMLLFKGLGCGFNKELLTMSVLYI